MEIHVPLGQFVYGFLLMVCLIGGCGKAPSELVINDETKPDGKKTAASGNLNLPSTNKARSELVTGPNAVTGSEIRLSASTLANSGVPPAMTSSTDLKIVQPSTTLPADKQLHTYHKVEAAFLSHDGSILARQFSMPGEKGMRYWIELSDTSNGTVITTIECNNRIWGGTFREDGQQFVVWDIGLTFYSIDGTQLGTVRGIGSQPVQLGYSVGFGYSNDNKSIFSLSKDKLYLVDAEKRELISELEIRTGSDGDAEFLLPRRLPGSDDLLLATKQGELFRWTIGINPARKVGEMQVTEGSRLMQAWPVTGNSNQLLSKRYLSSWKIIDVDTSKQIQSLGDGSASTAWYGLTDPIGYIDDDHFIDCEASSRDVRGPVTIKISPDGFQPITLFQIPSESTIQGRDGRMLLSGDGSTLVSLLPFKEILVYNTSAGQ